MSWAERTEWMKDCLPQLGITLHPGIREIRLRPDQRVMVAENGGNRFLAWTPGQWEIEQAAEALCGRSLYARREEAAQGSITLRGGHRLGLCGRMTGTRLEEISSLCLRLAGEWPGAADALIERIGIKPASVLVIGPPGAGKTTLLRDLCRQYANRDIQVALHDQRGELAAMVQGTPQLDVGPCTDVLEGCFKREGMWRLIRTMSPEVVITDEISDDEAGSVEKYSHYGVKVCASAHGTSWERAARRLGLYPMVPGGLAFDWYALLDKGKIVQILNREGKT